MQPDRDLDRELRDLGPRVEYPPVPDLARQVRNRLESESTGPPTRNRPQVWWIAAAALLLLVTVPVVSLAVRDTSGEASSGAGGGVAVESGGREAGDAGPTRLTEEAATGPTHSAEEDGSGLAAGAGEGAPSSGVADSGASAASASAEGACFSPEPILEAQPSRGAPKDRFGIRGRNFDADVRDCGDDPARSVRVEFLQGGRTWELGTVEASKGSRLAARLEVPADARPGRATVRATYDQRSSEDPHGRTSATARFFVTG